MYVNFIYASKNKNQTTQDIEKISVKQNKQTKFFNFSYSLLHFVYNGGVQKNCHSPSKFC
jgi:hypothetical protein